MKDSAAIAPKSVGVTVRRSWALEGCFIQSDLRVESGGRVSHSLGYIGFDTSLRVYVSVQLDSDTGMIEVQRASFDAPQKRLIFRGQSLDRETGIWGFKRSVLDFSNEGKHRFVSYRDPGNGRETEDYSGALERVK